METIFCNGCGIQIQTTDPEKLGYAPSSSLNRDTILCQRCFRLKHYNEIQDISMSDEDFMQLVSSISEQEGLVVYIIDIFDVSGSFIPGINRIVGNHPIILV
ncbi:MAG TPA: ribosome biogenesis GTPase YqeH, partial [Bacillota bacterium]|nr:ribosome biogenesis GTPase YqeH [Bacillota bacterium]